MNLLHLYAAYDRKAEYYLPVFQTKSEGEAIRSFTEAVVNSETPLSRYPAEYDLCHLGDMDMETGEIFPKFPVGLIINGLVAMQAAHAERARYAKALNPQTDIEEFIAEGS